MASCKMSVLVAGPVAVLGWVFSLVSVVLVRNRLLGFKHRSQDLPHIFHDFFLRPGIRMYAIRLKKFSLVSEPVQEEWYQFESMAVRQLRIDILKLLRICHAIIRRELHTGQQYRCLVPTAGLDDGFQIVANGVDGRAAQPVIAAEFDDDDIRTVGLKRAFDAIASTHCGFPADAVVDQGYLRYRLQPFLQKINPASLLRQSVTGG